MLRKLVLALLLALQFGVVANVGLADDPPPECWPCR